MSARRWSLIGLSALAGLVAAGVILLVLRVNRSAESAGRPALAPLVSALSGQRLRLVEGRISGLPYGERPGGTRGDPPLVPPDVRIGAAQLEKLALTDDSAESSAALGIAYAATGDVERSVAALEDALEREPGNGVYLNDLSAAYLARATRQSRAEDIPRALAVAERAMKASPEATEPLFNRALALELLHLHEDANRAWTEYAGREPDARWRGEAEQRAAELMRPPSPSWTTARSRLLPALAQSGRGAEAEIFERYVQPVREEIENVLLPGWAADWAAKRPEATDRLAEARALARALADSGGDPMSLEGIAAIDQAVNRRDEAAVSRLAEAHLAFSRGNQRYFEGKIHEAVIEFDKSAAVFAKYGSPFGLWARAYQALALRADGRLDEALSHLQTGDFADRRHRYGLVNGRAAWFEGLIAGEMGRPDEAAEYYRNAFASFKTAGERGLMADAEGLIAYQFYFLGRMAEAWSFNLSSIDHYWRARGRHGRVAMESSTYLALAGGLPEAALHFQDVVVRVVDPAQQVVMADALQLRARIRAVLGQSDQAWADIDAAGRAVDRMDDPGSKRRIAAVLQRTRAEADLALATNRSPEAASQALQFFRGVGFPFETVGVLRTRARRHVAAADFSAAEADLRDAIGEFERQRQSMKDERLRVTSFEEGALAFEEMFRVQALHQSQWRAAFLSAERGRAMSFRLAPSSPSISAAFDLEAARQRLPPNLLVLYFVALDDRLVVFTVSRDRFAWVERPVGRDQLAMQVQRLRSKVAADRVERFRPLLRELHDELIGSQLPPQLAIAIIPDGPLNDVAFGALLQPTGRFVAEDHPVVVAPSLAVLLRATESWAGRGPLQRALVVSPTATSDSGIPVPVLPEAQAEAVTIAGDYPHATMLTGPRATRDAFESSVGGADVIHFAGHAVANVRYPLLSRLLLTASDSAGGALTAFELERLPLSRARVVTLAACEAAGGAYVRGEGTLSLARPWLRAGASSVVASVWPIEDAGARRLFTGIHRRMSSGLHPAIAVQQAQAEAARDPKISFRDWAGLTVFGAAAP